MHTPRSLLVAFATALVLSPTCTPSHAAPCAGFGDVDATNPFCANVEWLKNRQVTIGCNGPSVYCPNEVVTRLSMATFLSRLGNALTTTHVVNVTDSAGIVDLVAGTTLCPREHFGLAWPRRTHGQAIVTLNALGNGPADVAINLVESTDNGTTWTDVSPAQHFTALGTQMGGAVHFVTATALLPPRDHAAGVEYMYAIRMGRVPGSTTTSDVGVLSCVLDLYNDNRQATSSPFDAED
jgi:hypothetical protein